jgi:hypothetical protein
MEYKIHKVVSEEKVIDISKKYNISVDEIKKANPDAHFFKGILGTEYVGLLQDIKIPQKNIIVKEESEEKKFLKELNFEKIARFRCSQTNVTKALDSVTFSSNIKTQYLFSTVKEIDGYIHVLLEDYIYQITPIELEIAFQLVKPIELFIKNDIKFKQNNHGELEKILNFNQIKQNWVQFKTTTLPSIDFFKQLKKQSEQSSDDFIRTADEEFSNETKFKEILKKNLFYHIFLKSNIGCKLENYTFSQYSQLFPNQALTISVIKTKVSEDENTIVFKLVGELQKENLSEEELRKQYDEIYKPILKYSYTEYDYIYIITYTLDAKKGLLLGANALFSEKVKNNFESITQFEINQVEL